MVSPPRRLRTRSASRPPAEDREDRQRTALALVRETHYLPDDIRRQMFRHVFGGDEEPGSGRNEE